MYISVTLHKYIQSEMTSAVNVENISVIPPKNALFPLK